MKTLKKTVFNCDFWKKAFAASMIFNAGMLFAFGYMGVRNVAAKWPAIEKALMYPEQVADIEFVKTVNVVKK